MATHDERAATVERNSQTGFSCARRPIHPITGCQTDEFSVERLTEVMHGSEFFPESPLLLPGCMLHADLPMLMRLADLHPRYRKHFLGA